MIPANVPPHWTEKLFNKPGVEASAWLVGQAVSAEAALALLADQARNHKARDRPWPEFSEYDCYAAGSGDARYGNRKRRPRLPQRAGCHRKRNFARNGTVVADEIGIDAQHLGLGFIGVCDKAALENIRRSRNRCQRRGHKPAGARLGGRDHKAQAARPL